MNGFTHHWQLEKDPGTAEMSGESSVTEVCPQPGVNSFGYEGQGLHNVNKWYRESFKSRQQTRHFFKDYSLYFKLQKLFFVYLHFTSVITDWEVNYGTVVVWATLLTMTVAACQY